MKRMWIALAVALIAPGAVAHGAAQRLELREGAFGFVNSEGSEIINLSSVTISSVPLPTALRAAVCGGARVYRVAHARRQAQQPAAGSAAVAKNFQNIEGDVFRIVDGRARGDETCYLTADSGLVASATAVGAPSGPGCDPAWLRRAAAAKRRPVLHCWPMASASPDAQIFALQFAVVDSSALASLVVAADGRLLYHDFPAKYEGPETTTWRVDDEGVFYPQSFEILFFGRVRGASVMAVTWDAFEGESDMLLVADSADAFRTVTSAYRYWGAH